MDRDRRIDFSFGKMMLLILQIIYIIIVGVIIKNVLLVSPVMPEITFVNGELLMAISGLPVDAKTYIERALYSTVARNVEINDDVVTGGAMIREQTMTYAFFDKIDVNYIYFIADIPNLNQTYQIKYEWSNNPFDTNLSINNRLMVMCPNEEQLSYDGFECKDDYNQNGDSLIMYEYISKNSFSGFEVVLPSNFSQEVVISDFKIKLLEKSEAEAISELKDFIKKLGIDAERFKYTVIK